MADTLLPRGMTVLLDPMTVQRPSSLKFRALQAFTDSGFAKLKMSVGHLSGNIQPIKVRPLHGGGHELVFGTRRLQACLELGLPVAAVVQELSGMRMVEELDASNDDSQVSVYERGCLYEAALSAGFYPSRRRLAEAIGRELRDVSNAVTVAQLPKALLDRLADPREVKVSIAKRIAAAVATDPDAVERRLVQAQVNRSTRMADLVKALRGTGSKA